MYYKYPRTPHVPWSQPDRIDDIYIADMSNFIDRTVVVTEKMDGENTTMYPDYIHARSIDSGHHPSRSYVKGIWGRIKHEIRRGWRICGENVYAQHTVPYQSLSDYFLVYSIWDNRNVCLSWDVTVKWCETFGLSTVPVLWTGVYDEVVLKSIQPVHTSEGWVIRHYQQFGFADFGKSVAKYVNHDFKIPDEHWMSKPVIPNILLRDHEKKYNHIQSQ